MGKKTMDLQKYHNVVLELKRRIQAGEPIHRSSFIKDNEILASFFVVLEKCKFIKEVAGNASTRKPGETNYSWIYSQASNETDSRMVMRVIEKITEHNQATWKKYSSPEWKEKQRLKKLSTSTIISRRPVEVAVEPVNNILLAAIEEERSQHQEFIPVVEERLADTETLEPIENETLIQTSTLSLEMGGQFTKEALLKKLQLLMEDKRITSFNFEVTYSN